MRIAIGADHAGFELKEHLKRLLAAEGYAVEDVGTHDTTPTDYPDYAAQVAHEVAQGQAERGILVCMTGMGMAMAANKVKGIRAALATNPEEVALTRKHNNANVLALSERYTKPQEADEMTRIFLNTAFESGGRHERRVNKMMALEREEAAAPGVEEGSRNTAQKGQQA
jgi:ribose 5-phosphate isomerase B